VIYRTCSYSTPDWHWQLRTSFNFYPASFILRANLFGSSATFFGSSFVRPIVVAVFICTTAIIKPHRPTNWWCRRVSSSPLWLSICHGCCIGVVSSIAILGFENIKFG
jgi:hypothetical protein